jgi:hypothetical protein
MSIKNLFQQNQFIVEAGLINTQDLLVANNSMFSVYTSNFTTASNTLEDVPLSNFVDAGSFYNVGFTPGNTSITVEKPGYYLCTVCCHVSKGNVATTLFGLGLYVDDVVTKLVSTYDLTTLAVGDVVEVTFSGVITINDENSVLKLKCYSASNTSQIGGAVVGPLSSEGVLFSCVPVTKN